MKTNFNPFPEIKTERLLLKQIVQTDAEALSALRSIDSVNQYIERAKTQSLEEAKAQIERLTQFLTGNTGITWTIELAPQPGLIGTICLFNFSAEHERAELGYELHPDYQGKGVMQEAVAAVIDYATKVMLAKEIEAVTHRDNAASLKLLQRFSFVRNESEEQRIGINELQVYILQIP
jgi:ribosomal-protein-alanine N-acetyltransferase